MTSMRTGSGLLAMLLAAVLWPGELRAQLAAPNAAGVSMGHVHYTVGDVDAHVRFWTALGGRAISVGGTTVMRLPDVLVFLSKGEVSVASGASVVNHIAFRVPALTAVEAAGLTVQRLAQFPGVAYVPAPESDRIELFEDAATNLTFTPASGPLDPVAARHNRPVAGSIAFHHIHLYVPDGAVAEAQAWYVRMFGGTPGKRSQYDAVDFPGMNLNISRAPTPTTGSKGRMLDHIGFEVVNLEAFCRRLVSMGVTFDVPYGRDAAGLGRAVLTDPWGTSIELTEGLAGL